MINVEKDSVLITLNKDFYDPSVVSEALEHFSEICQGKFGDNDKLNIVLSPKEDVDLKTLGYEFCNYLLALMKNKGLV